MVFIATVRMTNVSRYETSWDVFGYYLYLPAVFIEGDPMLNDRSWVEEMNKDNRLSSTLYQLSQNDEGEPMYFFLMGMSLLYLPFFLLGHGIAWVTGSPMDGLSEPYQYALAAGGVVYTLLGLWLFRKILLRFFSHQLTAALLLIVVFATNYSHHMTYKNLETVNMLFTLMCWLLWSTMRWHEEHRFPQLLQIGVAITLMSLVKPSEVLAVIIPVLWSVYSIPTLKEKIALLRRYRLHLVTVFGVCLLIGSPQILYWYLKTGHFFYDSYKNPGVGIDLLHPHTWHVLFSARKGWLVYTPVMLLGLIGFYFFLKQRKAIATALFTYFCVSFFIISCWTEWWYGAAFSCRPVIISYPILAIAMGTFFQQMKSSAARWSIGIFAVLCFLLNQFQWWQLREGILDPYRTTPAYYHAIFLKTKIPQGAEALKSIERSFAEKQEWKDRAHYREIKRFNVRQPIRWSADEFQFTHTVTYHDLTAKDHLFVEVDVVYEIADSASYGPFLTVTALHKGEAYHYRSPELKTISTDTVNALLHAHYTYLTPEIRAKGDQVSVYIWNPGKNKLRIQALAVRYHAHKD